MSRVITVDLCADEILRAVVALRAILPVPVEVSDVAERIGATASSVRPRMARLAAAGKLTRDGALYSIPGGAP